MDLKAFIIYIISCVLLLGGIIAFSLISMNVKDNKTWNDGHCQCGGTWQYEQAVGHYTSTHYIYKCDACNKRIEVSKIK